jgi:hypothetical protein
MNAQMTVTFPDCLDSMQGADCNFELVASSTLKPLRLIFDYHVARCCLGYVFVQEELTGVGKWTGTELTQGPFQERIGDVLSARDIGERSVHHLKDKEALGLSEVDLLLNLSKTQTIDKYHAIAKHVEELKKQHDSIAIFVIVLGYQIDA